MKGNGEAGRVDSAGGNAKVANFDGPYKPAGELVEQVSVGGASTVAANADTGIAASVASHISVDLVWFGD